MTRDELLKYIRVKYGLNQNKGFKNRLSLDKILKIVSKDDREKIMKAYNLNNEE
jgi:hypothetical protein